MLLLQGVGYNHPNKDVLFSNINFVVNKQEKTALIGNNGTGKSSLLRIMAGHLHPSSGTVKTDSRPYYVPQIFGQYNDYSIARALRIEEKLKALKEILSGNTAIENFTLLDDDWALEERCREALAHWELDQLDLSQKLSSLSGGQKTRIFLAGVMIHQPDIVLLDEPSNHLDGPGRKILYDYIHSATGTLVVVSHDQGLLNLLDSVAELGKQGLSLYGGNYEFYLEQKELEREAFHQDLKNKEKALRHAKETEKETLERKQKQDARGRKKQEKAGTPAAVINGLRNNAEKSAGRLKDMHAGKVEGLARELQQLRDELPDPDKMKIGFDHSALHHGKNLVSIHQANYGYDSRMLWPQPLNMVLTSGERISLGGPNGSGKTTLIKMILGELQPHTGSVERAVFKSLYIDQDYSLIDTKMTVYEQARRFNDGSLQEHEIKIRLNRFLFSQSYWDKSCSTLSGGEKMRLMLCSLSIASQAPDLIVLDEPTNNLDIQNVDILTTAINEYRGTLLVVSHDAHFLKQIHIGRFVDFGHLARFGHP